MPVAGAGPGFLRDRGLRSTTPAGACRVVPGYREGQRMKQTVIAAAIRQVRAGDAALSLSSLSQNRPGRAPAVR